MSRYLLSIFRSHIAKEIIEKYKFTQVEVAEKLGTTQAAISQYLRLKRGHKSLERFISVLLTIQSVTSDVAREIASGRIGQERIALKFCEIKLKFNLIKLKFNLLGILSLRKQTYINLRG